MTKTQTFVNVWEAIEDTPEDAAAMTARSEIMSAVTDEVRAWKMPQREAADRLGVTQPRLNDLLQGKINKFSLDALLTLAGRAGLDVKFTVQPAAVGATRTIARRGSPATSRKTVYRPMGAAAAKRAPKLTGKRTV
jgi:predicted XRE-type DNA-binding protein